MTDRPRRLLLAVCVLAVGSVSAARADFGSFPIINSATYDAGTQVLTLSGVGLTDSGRTPTLLFNNAPLMVTTATSTRITAMLPNTTPPGSYLITIHRYAFGDDDQVVAEVTIGAVGPQGPQGIQGPMGPMGLQGPQGMAGAQGGVGAQGPAGAIGPQGGAGTTGAAGAQGQTGNAGAPGAKGDTGATGATGAQGPAGVAGAAGLTGNPGAAGAAGSAGPKGETGAQGVAGAGVTVADVAAGGACGPLAGVKVTDGANSTSIVCDGQPGATGPAGPAGVASAAGPGSGPSVWSARGSDFISIGVWPPAVIIEKTVAGSAGYVASASLSIGNAGFASCNLLATSNGSRIPLEQKQIHPSLSATPTLAPVHLQAVFPAPDLSAVTFQVTCYDAAPTAVVRSLSLIVMGVALQP